MQSYREKGIEQVISRMLLGLIHHNTARKLHRARRQRLTASRTASADNPSCIALRNSNANICFAKHKKRIPMIDLTNIKLLSREMLRLKLQPYQRHFDHENSDHRLIILLGHRGVGKTTLLAQQLLNSVDGDLQSDKILYVPIDHFLLNNEKIYLIAERFQMMGGQTIAFYEIHKYPNWSMELKSINDTFPKLKVLASGSSALEIHKGSHDLSRRAILTYIHGLSLREYINLNLKTAFENYSLKNILSHHEKLAHPIISTLDENNHKILDLLQRYLETGYYPYFLALQNKQEYLLTIEQDIHTTIESDLLAIYPHINGISLKKIKQLFSFIAESVPFTPNWSKIKSLLSIGDTRTLQTYFKYLEDAGLIRTLLSASQKLQKIEQPAKVLLNNTNQMFALSTASPNPGNLRETFIINTLKNAKHEVTLADKADFVVDKNIILEVGGRNKDNSQIKNQKNAFLICDDIECGISNKIPLWLFGFLS